MQPVLRQKSCPRSIPVQKPGKDAIAAGLKLMVVTASPGAGKSTLAGYLETLPEENWRLSLIHTGADMTLAGLPAGLRAINP